MLSPAPGLFVPPTSPVAPWRDSLALAVASLALYLALAQEALHGLDVHVHVFFLTHGVREHPLHLAYLQIAGAAWPALSACGLSPHHALRLLSALGTAAGVFGMHRAAARLLPSRLAAAVVAATAAVAPGVVFFATVPEIHGVFLAFAGLVWWAFAAFLSAPRVSRAAWLGAASGVAASVHATGHLLLGVCGLCVLACRPARSRSWALLALAAAMHLTVALGFAWWLQPERVGAPFAGQLGYLRYTAQGLEHSLGNAWHVARNEWLLAFAPTALTSWLVWLRPGGRRIGLAMLVGVCTYLAVSFVLLDYLEERGAYLLPLALLFAWLTFLAGGLRLTVLCAAVGLVAAIWQVRRHDRVEPAAWLPGFLAVAREAPPAVVCFDVVEQEAITRALPEVPFVRVDSLLASADAGEAGYAAFCRDFDAIAQYFRGQGRAVLITRAAYEGLLASGKPFFARFLQEHLPRAYRTEEVSRDGFVAIRLR